jgi:NitT/TauT family transport system substrate-binding protein
MKKLLLVAVAAAILIAAGAYFLFNQHSFLRYITPVEKISVGAITEYSTLILVAQGRGYFVDNGLDVTIVNHPSGANAFSDLLAHKVDVVTTADFVPVLNSFTSQDFKIVATMAKVKNGFELVARKDHGIQSAADLKGKVIGVTKKTAGEYWLSALLTFNNLSPNDIKVVDLPPLGLKAALLKGDVDAIMTFEPYVFDSRQSLGNKAVAISGQSDKDVYIFLSTTNEFIRDHPQTLERFLRALRQAELYTQTNPTETVRIVAEQDHRSDTYMREVFPKFKPFLSLDSSALSILEDQAQWAILSKITDHVTLPNFNDYIYSAALRKVNPGEVTLY